MLTVNDKYIFDKLMSVINNPFGVCALMGNLYAESALNSKNLQNSYEKKLGFTDETYTNAVDRGIYSRERFIKDSAGYGLAQWTYWSRKQNLYNFVKKRGGSIGNLDLQLDFLIEELKAYRVVWNNLITAVDVESASNAVVLYYERPADQSAKNLKRRADIGLTFYNYLVNDDYITYVVKAGDSLWKIAQRFYKNGLKWKKIYEDNHLKTKTIEVGQILKIMEVK